MKKSILTAVSLLATVSTFAAAPAESEDSAPESVPFTMNVRAWASVGTGFADSYANEGPYVGWISRLLFSGSGSDNGYDYGFKADLNLYRTGKASITATANAGTSAEVMVDEFDDADAQTITLSIDHGGSGDFSDAYVYIGTKNAGRFSMGQLHGAATKSGKVPGGGVATDFFRPGFNHGFFSSTNVSGRSPKILYTMPAIFDGLSASISYTPKDVMYYMQSYNPIDFGTTTNDDGVTSPAKSKKDIVEIGAKYSGDMFSVYGALGIRSRAGENLGVDLGGIVLPDTSAGAVSNAMRTKPFMLIGVNGNFEDLSFGISYQDGLFGTTSGSTGSFSNSNTISIGVKYPLNDVLTLGAQFHQAENGFQAADTTVNSKTTYDLEGTLGIKVNSAVDASVSFAYENTYNAKGTMSAGNDAKYGLMLNLFYYFA